MLAAALRAEAASFVASLTDKRLADGRQRVVHHGTGPARAIQTGIGAVPVQRHKVRDRATDVPAEERIRFTSSILPRWARRSCSLDALLQVLYLRGVSTGDFQDALTALLGGDAPNLSPGVISRLTAGWQEDYDRWQRRDLSARNFPPASMSTSRPNGVYLQARMGPTPECMLVEIGATAEGRKELFGFQVGARESAQSWHELLVDLKARGLGEPPKLAAGDGALGFWKALEGIFPGTRHQRCWFHKMSNVLKHFPKSTQPAVTVDLRKISHAEHPSRGAGRHRDLQAEIRRQIRPRRRLPAQGQRGPAGLLRLPGRALGPLTHLEPDRERVRHRPPPGCAHEGRAVTEDRETHGLHSRQGGFKDMAQIERHEPVAEHHRRRQVHRRRRTTRRHPKPRRMKEPRHPNLAIARYAGITKIRAMPIV